MGNCPLKDGHITNHCEGENANQNHNEILFHAQQDSYDKNKNGTKVLVRISRNYTSTMLVGM